MGNDTEGKTAKTERSGYVARPRFKKGYEEWIVFMPIAIPGVTVTDEDGNETTQTKHLKVGDTLKKGEIRLHVLKMFFLRGRIGPKGHPWTERRLEKWRLVDEQRQKELEERARKEAEENAKRKVVEAAEAQEEAKRKLQEAKDAEELVKVKEQEAQTAQDNIPPEPPTGVKIEDDSNKPPKAPTGVKVNNGKAQPRRRGRPPKQ